jgi:hypothetical protein
MMAQLHSDSSMATTTRLGAALRARLSEYPDSNWYALLDAAQLPDLRATILRSSSGKMRYLSLFDETPEAGDGDVAPYLVDLGSAANQNPAIGYTVKKALETHAISWLASPLDLPALAKRLTCRLDAQLAENIDVLLRFYDSRILSTLRPVLSPDQASIFFNAAHAWWYADRAGELQSCECTFTKDDPFRSPIKFNQIQEDQFTELAFPDAVLEQLLKGQSDLLASMNRAGQHAFVVRQMVETKTLRLESLSDILTYCILALVEGEDFGIRTPWKEKFAAVAAGQSTFNTVIA